MLHPENRNKHYNALFSEIESGKIKLPMFQRDFVWDKEQTARLLDSILKGFPIGTFIFWGTREELRSYRNIGNHDLPQIPKGDYASYILDGQQRITSLYAVRAGLRLSRDGQEINYKDIVIDLEYNAENNDQIVLANAPAHPANILRFVSVHDVLTRSLLDFGDDGFDRAALTLIEGYKNKLTSYDFSTISIADYPIEVACEIFARINTSGKSLSVFEVMVAKTYDEKRAFDLAEKYELLRDGADGSSCLRDAKFETLPEVVVMQCVAVLAIRGIRSRDILKIKRAVFIDNWDAATASLLEAIDFVRHQFRVPVSQLLPYPSMLVPLTYWFSKNANRKPNARQRVLLEQWFYWVGLNYRYSAATETKIVEDLDRMDLILAETTPDYRPDELTLSADNLAQWTFSAGDASCKTILCLLAFQQPKGLHDDGIVNLDNSNLRIATSRNYHHFFPKAYLKSHQPSAEPNLMVNITLIDGDSNKRLIGAKAPGVYIREFEKKDNPNLTSSLKTHLISDREKFGVLANDYDLFVAERSKAIAAKLNRKLRNP